MRERLIELLKNKFTAKPCFGEECLDENHTDSCDECLADYLLENGVVALPCKVGNTVYVVKNIDDCAIAYVKEHKLTDIAFDGKGFLYQDWFENWYTFGQNVFATKEEAEARLAELKGE